jgi:hypothetical protein
MFTFLKICARELRIIQDVIVPYFPYILLSVLRKLCSKRTQGHRRHMCPGGGRQGKPNVCPVFFVP